MINHFNSFIAYPMHSINFVNSQFADGLYAPWVNTLNN